MDIFGAHGNRHTFKSNAKSRLEYSSTHWSGFTEEQDIQWQADAIRRAIDEGQDPDILRLGFPRGWKRMKEDDAKEEAKIIVHEQKENELVVHPNPPPPSDRPKSIYTRFYDAVKNKGVKLWNYFFG